MSKPLTPQIRFKGYTQQWIESSLGEMGTTYSGLSGKSKDDFGHGSAKYVTYLNVFNNPLSSILSLDKIELDNSQMQVKYGDVFFTTSSETPEEVGMTSIWLHNLPNVYLNSFCFGFRPSFQIDPFFLAFTLRSTDFRKKMAVLAQGISRYNISKKKVMELSLPFSLYCDEQRQIGEFFKQLGEVISEVEREIGRLEKMKLASLQKMFPRPGATTPEIRFAGFEGEWTIGPLSDLLEIDDIRNSKNELGREDVLSVSGEYGLVNQIEFQGRSFAGASLTGYKITNKAHVVYTKSPLKAQPFGIIKSNQYGLGLLSPLYAVYKPKNHASADFIHYYFSPIARLNNYLRPLINKGAKNTLLISDEVALQGYIVYPSDVEEQCVIAHYFRNLDELISAKRQKLAKLRNIKNSCLDKMFVNTFNL